MSSTKRIIKNTGFQYVRMFVTILISLYSVRLVLSALGVEDYGIYSLVAGVIATLSFLNGAMTVSTQRYLSFYLGKGDLNKLTQVFQTSVTLHLVIGIFVVVLLEVLGIFLFNGFLSISSDRIASAKIVYHCTVISTFFTINAVSYDSAINAHEDLLYDAVLGILESLVKLALAIMMIYYGSDKLIFYGITMAALVIIIRIIKSYYCYKKYEECKIKKLELEPSLFKEMFAFAGWNTFGAACAVVRSQGLAIVLNIFLGTVVNAAYGIAMQINWQLRNFALNMLKAIRPQIIKSEGDGNREQMLQLSMIACKYGFFLIAFVAVPLIIEMKFVLTMWLHDVPDYTIVFCILIVIQTLLNNLTIGLQTALQATGNIRTYQFIVGTTILLNLPVAWLLLHFGMSPNSVLISAIIIELIASFQRIYFADTRANLPWFVFTKKVIISSLIPFILTLLVSLIPSYIMNESFLRLLITVIVSSVVMLITIYNISLTQFERSSFQKIGLKLFDKLKVLQRHS